MLSSLQACVCCTLANNLGQQPHAPHTNNLGQQPHAPHTNHLDNHLDNILMPLAPSTTRPPPNTTAVIRKGVKGVACGKKANSDASRQEGRPILLRVYGAP
eukprot:350137-Chlamydomonas_euryale.AAC.2